MKTLYELEKASKQAHAQHQTKELMATINEQEVLNQIAQLRIKHPALGLKKLYHKVKPVNMGRD
jgi:DNA-binding transcriptional regulator WhiA